MEGKAIAYNYQYITDGSTLAVIPLSQRLQKCLQTNGFDVIGLISADVGKLSPLTICCLSSLLIG